MPKITGMKTDIIFDSVLWRRKQGVYKSKVAWHFAFALGEVKAVFHSLSVVCLSGKLGRGWRGCCWSCIVSTWDNRKKAVQRQERWKSWERSGRSWTAEIINAVDHTEFVIRSDTRDVEMGKQEGSFCCWAECRSGGR